MSWKYFRLVLRNISRSKTRMLVTVLGCAIASFIICFFLSADMSMGRMISNASDSSNIVITQKDKY